MINQLVIYSDLHYSFTKDTQGDIRKAYNTEAVGVSLRNILGTNKGERVMLPEFGANLRGMLFERMDFEFSKVLANQIKREIERWDPRISILSMDFQQEPSTLSVTLVVRFTVKGSSQIEELTQLIS
jgi:phage baseplate assembly protein W